ncbi:endonuclease V isoform X1 [Trifolium pratense]|uniref:endonuclease V isoform X1 n=1 Tax=Trifolium pratense TaxID=57577 RepID=UPI001E6907A7|nr:endonuclease V isoform X1 [Trifolium pratense]
MARLLLCQKATTRNHRCKPLHRALQLYGVSVVGIFCRRSRSISIPRTKAMEKSSQTEEQSQSHDSSTSSHDRQNWKTEQNILKEKLITEDNFTWKLPPSTSQELRYVGGCDISFSKHDPSLACGTLVVLDFHTLEVVYQDFSLVTLNVPYVAGFLAFREAPVILDILEKMKRSDNPFYPQLLMVDGNGILHPRGFGLACHIGVTADLPTIGVGKNLHCVDGLNQSRVRKLLEAKENTSKDFVTLVGCSGRTWGVAMRSTQGSVKPIFISIGHRISLQTATAIVQMTCKYRVPEPIRQADIRSRDYIRKFEMNPKLRLLSE